MKINLRILFIILSLVLLAAMVSRGQALSIDPDPGQPDQVIIESVVAFTAGSAVVPIRVVNDETLNSIEITLTHDSPYITLDSFVFADRLVNFNSKLTTPYGDSILTISAFTFGEPLSTGSGSIGNLYFSWQDDIPIHEVLIDTISFIAPLNILRTTNFIHEGYEGFIPEIVQGTIDIQSTPVVMDSIWISDTTGYIGSPVTVDVNLYNEWNIKRVSVTLAYGAGELQFDSVTFDGTRGSDAFPKSVQFRNSLSQLYLSIEWNSLSPLPPGSGVLAQLHFTVSATAPVQPIEIVAKDFLGITTTFIDMTEADGSLQIIPIFSSGIIDIQSPPILLDSIWISDTTGYTDSSVTVDVNLYNERNIKSVTVALAYGAGEIEYDSVTFSGTRGISANSTSVQYDNSFNQLALEMIWEESSPLAPGTGILAHLHFTVSETAAGQLEILNNDFQGFTTHIELTTVDGSYQFFPEFSSGTITIEVPTDVGENNNSLPNQFRLGQNYPNPFNPETTITFSLPTSETTQLTIYNVLGRKVRELISGKLTAGQHQIVFDGRTDSGNQLASGIYYYTLTAGSHKDSNKMVLLK